MSPRQKDGLKGSFLTDAPSMDDGDVDAPTWIAAWHVDNDLPSVTTPGTSLLNCLCTLKWTARSIREMSTRMVLEELNACGYTAVWAPRLAGDIKATLFLKDLGEYLADMSEYKIPINDIPLIKILPNKTFVDFMPFLAAGVDEVRTWFHFWFDNRMEEPNFKRFSTKFQYQSPDSLVDELELNGYDLQTLTRQELQETSLGRNLRPVYLTALLSDIRAARKKLRDDMARKQKEELSKTSKKRTIDRISD